MTLRSLGDADPRAITRIVLVHEAMDKDGLTAYFGEEVHLRGVIEFGGTVQIDGRLDGEVRTDGMLVIGEHATGSARVRARVVVCRGKMRGDLVATDTLRLFGSAEFEGTIQVSNLLIQEGVRFNGTSVMPAGPIEPGSLQEHPSGSHVGS